MMIYFSSLKWPTLTLELEIAEPTSVTGFDVDQNYWLIFKEINLIFSLKHVLNL